MEDDFDISLCDFEVTIDKLPISLCMLTLNEADRLEKSLEPLNIFEEIIVFDSGSTDGSIKLCEEAGAKVFQVEWEGFGITRRKLFEKATQPWVLWLDADEVITPKLRDELYSLFSDGEPLEAAFAINRIVNFNDKWIKYGDWFPDWNVRLFRANAWSMPPVAVHESLKIKGEISQMHGLLEHYTYRDWADQKKRSERYAGLWAKQKFKEGKTASIFSGPSHAFGRFLKGYLLKRGFMDGVLGFQIALANAKEVYRKYQLLRAEYKGL